MLMENETRPGFNRTRAQSSPLSVPGMQLRADVHPPELRLAPEDVLDGKAIAAVRFDYGIAAEQEGLVSRLSSGAGASIRICCG